MHSPPPGTEIGRYRLLGEIGRGGMGVVYLAERADGAFDHQVALKILRWDGGPEAARALERERRILAQLDHPNIARLIDGGVSSEGWSYLVTERVDGVPIDVYCERERPTVRERLAMFQVVCEAVDAAHRRLIVHRDLKPSNILVTGDGTVKLLDFGVARWLDEEAGARPSAQTPQYASPEQHRGGAVAIASDVYQLGLVLFELLCGLPPYEVSGAPPAVAERLICEVPSPSPSAVVARSSGGADRRSPSSYRLARELAGDLDRLVGKALAKDPDQRYASVAALRGDIERYLRGLPITARRPRWSYRLGKFLRRHRLAAALSAVAAVAAVSLTAGFLVRLAQEREETREQAARAVAEQLRAERHRDETEQVVSFLLDLFEASDPYDAADPSVTARELLDRSAGLISQRPADLPSTRARLLTTLGRLYRRLGEWQRSEELLTRGVAMREAEATGSTGDLAESLHELGALLNRQGRHREAAARLQRALELWRSDPDTPHRYVSATLGSLAMSRHGLGDAAAAEQLERRAVAGLRADPADGRELAVGLSNLAETVRNRGDYGEAESLLLESLELWHASGTGDPRFALALATLGNLYAEMGRPGSALPLLERAVDAQAALLAPHHPALVRLQVSRATALLELDRREEAETVLRSTLTAIREGNGGEQEAALVRRNLANLLASGSMS